MKTISTPNPGDTVDGPSSLPEEQPELEDLPLYEPPPYLLPPPLGQRVAGVAREVARTPTRAALGTAAVLSAVIGLLALLPVTVRSADAAGPYRARCGLGYYLAGYPTAAVARTCHDAYGAHALVLLLAAVTLVISGVTLAVLIGLDRPVPRPWLARWAGWLRRQWATPVRAAALVFQVTAGVVALAALRTVSIPTRDARGPLVAHCGLSYYVFGTSDPPVQQACRGVYGGHAAVFFLAVGLMVVAALAVRRLAPDPAPAPPG